LKKKGKSSKGGSPLGERKTARRAVNNQAQFGTEKKKSSKKDAPEKKY